MSKKKTKLELGISGVASVTVVEQQRLLVFGKYKKFETSVWCLNADFTQSIGRVKPRVCDAKSA
mgnify:CR=1 FL=1